MIQINGKERNDVSGTCLQDFLAQEGYSQALIAVECNGKIVPKSAYSDKYFQDGDQMEIVQFVGGG